jgi:antitoxin component YwqK of YwqJK toxin-antitoxin module
MKNILLIVVLNSLFLQGCDGEMEQNGELVSNLAPHLILQDGCNGMTYEGELYSGKYVKYYGDDGYGDVKAQGSYKDGVMDGLWEYYYENGQLYSKGTFLNGEFEGAWEYNYENGQLLSKGSYQNGEKDGVWEEFNYINGKLSTWGSYLKGKQNGVWKYYNKDGDLIKEINFSFE